jgi:RNA polymerase sigma-70 factor (ECF subfamily)
MSEGDSTAIRELIGRFRTDDEELRCALLNRATDRLARLTRKMLRDYPAVHRWEETDDVLQNALMRLHRAMQQVSPPSVVDFFRLAALQIRRELIDLARHYTGPQGLAANYSSRAGIEGPDGTGAHTRLEPSDSTHDPGRLAEWTDLHRQVELLPETLRAVVDLLYYQGLTQAEAAEALGISERTVKRHWQAARVALHDALGGRLPWSR